MHVPWKNGRDLYAGICIFQTRVWMHVPLPQAVALYVVQVLALVIAGDGTEVGWINMHYTPLYGVLPPLHEHEDCYHGRHPDSNGWCRP